MSLDSKSVTKGCPWKLRALHKERLVTNKKHYPKYKQPLIPGFSLEFQA